MLCVIAKHAELDAYVLSESSLFVYPTKWVLKTCGTTKLLRAVPRLLEMAAQLSMLPRRCKYSRASFLFPEQQVGLRLHPATASCRGTGFRMFACMQSRMVVLQVQPHKLPLPGAAGGAAAACSQGVSWMFACMSLGIHLLRIHSVQASWSVLI
jgi:hypothetical protein